MAVARISRRRWLAPEVVQTSSMDCGPAALKCLLEGFHIPVSYGRLREACQTDVDGTSIDTVESVANQLGLAAEQEMLPLDHLFLDTSALLPALLVVRRPDGPPHFVVAWRRMGSWLQVMDPETGKRWVRCPALLDELYRHQTSVPAIEWRDWAGSETFRAPLAERLRLLGAARHSAALIGQAEADALWFGYGTLDAAIRLVELMARAGGVRRGNEAADLVAALFAETCASPDNIFKVIPPEYW